MRLKKIAHADFNEQIFLCSVKPQSIHILLETYKANTGRYIFPEPPR